MHTEDQKFIPTTAPGLSARMGGGKREEKNSGKDKMEEEEPGNALGWSRPCLS